MSTLGVLQGRAYSGCADKAIFQQRHMLTERSGSHIPARVATRRVLLHNSRPRQGLQGALSVVQGCLEEGTRFARSGRARR